VAQETAVRSRDAALKSFSQVYAMNIDYRDVAERIAALRSLLVKKDPFLTRRDSSHR